MGILCVLLAAVMISVTVTPNSDDSVTGFSASDENASALNRGALHRGWPVDLSSPGSGFPYTPLLVDMDNDGSCEIFVTGGETFGISGDGSFLPGWPTEEMAYMGYASTGQLPCPSAGDMNGDGEMEIIWSVRDWYAGSAHLWTFNGRETDGTDMNGFPMAAPDESSNALNTPFVLGDADGDGSLEAVTAHTLGNTGDYYRVSSVDFEGNILFTTDLDAEENILNIYFGDADGNDSEEFFAVTFSGSEFKLYLFSSDGSIQQGYPVILHTPPGGGSLMFGPPIAADMDGDGDLELILGYNSSSTSYAVAVNHNGSVLPGYPLPLATSSQLFYLGMGDVTGDGNPELIAVDNHLGSDYRVWVYDMATGSPLTGWPVAVTGWPKGFPSVADLDGDGVQDVSFSTDAGTVHALSGSGDELTGFPKNMAAPSTSGTAIGDIDGDGYYEIVAASWNGMVYAWNTEGQVNENNRDWPMRGIDPFNTGVFHTGSQSGIESSPSTVTITITTNPAVSSAVFCVSGFEEEPVVEIFDTTGRLIARTGTTWTPGGETPTGIYIARLSGSQENGIRFVLTR